MKLAVALFAAALLATGCGSESDGDGDATTVTGTVIAPDEAPPPAADTVLTVRIEDVSLADAPSVVIAEQEIVVTEGDFPGRVRARLRPGRHRVDQHLQGLRPRHVR